VNSLLTLCSIAAYCAPVSEKPLENKHAMKSEYPKFHFQNAFPTEKEAEDRAASCIGDTVIQKQEIGWCVFVTEYAPGQFTIR